MNSWVDKFKRLVVSSQKQHIIVSDEDNLFSYQELAKVFTDDGYIILTAKNSLQVRLFIELDVRNKIDNYLIIAPADYEPLPDILDVAHHVTIGLPQLFPNLDPKAIKGLSYNALSLLSRYKPYEEMGFNKTLKFLLENLYNVDFDTLTQSRAKERVMNALITVFLERNGINPPLGSFLSGIAVKYFPDLVQSGLNQKNLITYIQRQWALFVTNQRTDLDFTESLLSKSIGYLFAFQYILPVSVTPVQYESLSKFLRIGVTSESSDNNDAELENLTDYLSQQLGSMEDLAEQWFKIIQVVANAKRKSLNSTTNSLRTAFSTVEDRMNKRFQRFIHNTYGSLFSLSGISRPAVVSRILEHMNASAAAKKALLVIDGMNYWQSQLLTLALSENNISCSVSASLAYIPTITAWSRQAIFRGSKPDLNSTNAGEASLFESYWRGVGIPRHQIAFRKIGVNLPSPIGDISGDTTILGLVCNDLDAMMHGTVMGNEQLLSSTSQWITASNIVALIKDLQQKGFQIFITSDHGNIEAVGIKNLTIAEKVGSLSRSKRHIKFSNETMLNSFIDSNPSLELGKRELSVYLISNGAFTDANDRIITHGGSHFWEVIVPFIKTDEQ